MLEIKLNHFVEYKIGSVKYNLSFQYQIVVIKMINTWVYGKIIEFTRVANLQRSKKIIWYLTSKLVINKNGLNLIITEVVTIKVCLQFCL